MPQKSSGVFIRYVKLLGPVFSLKWTRIICTIIIHVELCVPRFKLCDNSCTGGVDVCVRYHWWWSRTRNQHLVWKVALMWPKCVKKKRRRRKGGGVVEVGDAFTWSRMPKLRAGVVYGSPFCSLQRYMQRPCNVVTNAICNVLLIIMMVSWLPCTTINFPIQVGWFLYNTPARNNKVLSISPHLAFIRIYNYDAQFTQGSDYELNIY